MPDPRLAGPSRLASSLAAVAVLALVAGSAACSPGDGASRSAAGRDAAAAEAGSAGGGSDAAQAQEAPACRFQAPEEELSGRASPPDSASVRLGDATAVLCYGAPSARGREVVGGLVPYGRPWRMGANEPTTLHLPFAAELGGVRLEPGSYSLYAIPGESEWTIVVNGDTERWGIPIDDEVRAADVGSFTVRPETLAEPVERLTMGMEPAGGDSARVTVRWERTGFSFALRRAEGGGGGG
ncbi:MAG TPA: DUF2911 domain-containing protein [Gemmatimonadota bacterium]|nr:DUF2911 domain-containing protein [Gemmatimonadota bacterium]